MRRRVILNDISFLLESEGGTVGFYPSGNDSGGYCMLAGGGVSVRHPGRAFGNVPERPTMTASVAEPVDSTPILRSGPFILAESVAESQFVPFCRNAMSSEELERCGPDVRSHFEDPYHRGECRVESGKSPTHAARLEVPLCGGWVRVELVIADEMIESAWFEGQGCVESQAAASMLMEKIEGMTPDELQRFSPPEMFELFGPGLLPSRQKCCLLAWRAVQRALDNSPDDIDAVDDTYNEEEDSTPRFGGPSLGEES